MRMWFSGRFAARAAITLPFGGYMRKRKKIKFQSKRMISFLIEYGEEPIYEGDDYTLFFWSPRLSELMENYYIRYTLIPNKV